MQDDVVLDWGISLKPMSSRNLMRQEESLRIAAFATKLERAEVFVPRAFRDFRLGFHPKPQLVQIVKTNVAVVHALDQMVTNGSGEP